MFKRGFGDGSTVLITLTVLNVNGKSALQKASHSVSEGVLRHAYLFVFLGGIGDGHDCHVQCLCVVPFEAEAEIYCI